MLISMQYYVRSSLNSNITKLIFRFKNCVFVKSAVLKKAKEVCHSYRRGDHHAGDQCFVLNSQRSLSGNYVKSTLYSLEN